MDPATNTQRRVAEFLMHNGGKRFCAPCVARAARMRNVYAVGRAIKALGSDARYRVEEAECGRCDQTAHTICALWMGL